MAKKFVRGITDVKTINNQDYDTNNVNDLLSDGQYNYIHRKKGKSEEYHNLTDNLKTLSSDNTDLLTVTNNNKTTNTATLHPKHDAQKEQLLESTRNTISIHHGENGTAEKTTVDTNPKKVLEHDNLVSASEYVTIEHGEESEISQIKTDKLVTKLDELDNKIPRKVGTVNLFKGSRDFTGTDWIGDGGVYAEDYQGVKIFKKQTMWSGRSQYFEVKTGEEYVFSAYVKSSAKTDRVAFLLSHSNKEPAASGVVSFGSSNGQDNVDVVLTDKYQRIAIKIKITKDGWIAPRLERSNTNAYLFFGGYKLQRYNVPTDYSPNPEDVYPLLSQKQDVLTAGDGITIQGQTIDTNPQKVLEHENLKTGDGLTTSFNTDETTIMFKATKKTPETNLNTLGEGVIRGNGFSIDQVPSENQDHSAAYVTINTSDTIKVQFYIRESGSDHGIIRLYYRFIINGEVTEWKEMVGDKSVIDAAINANTEKINQLTAKVTALEEKVAQLHPVS